MARADERASTVESRSSRFRVVGLIWEPLAAALIASVAFFVGFGGGRVRLGTPLGTGDMLPTYLAAKLWGDGSPFGNTSLGYPFGVELRYYPTTDVLQNALAGLFTALSGNPFFGMNAVFAASFPITAVAAWWAFRIARLRGPVAVFFAVAFTVIPYHWLRVEHIYLGTMYSAALGVALALLVGTGELERRLQGPRRWRWWALVVVISAVIATSGVYYACFTVLLCAVALVFRFAHGARWRGLLVAATPAAFVTMFTAAALAPAWYYERTHPALEAVADRFPWESVVYSGIFTNLLLPAPLSEIPGFEPINQAVIKLFIVETETPTGTPVGVLWYANFGSVMTVLAMGLLIVGVIVSARRRALGKPLAASTDGVPFGLVALLLGTTVLFFVPWGLNFLFAYSVTSQLRGWDRLVPVFFLLVFVGAATSWRRLRLPMAGLRAYATVGALAVVLVLDSVIPFRSGFDAAATTGRQNVEWGRTYADAVNDAVPGRCGVVQLPHIGYPEEPSVLGVDSYAPLWPALTNPEKNWTFGAMKRTLANAWLDQLGNELDSHELDNLSEGGFCAVHVDLRGFSAEDGAVLVADLTAALGGPVATGHEGSWLAFALPGHGPVTGLDERSLDDLSDDLQLFYAPPTVSATAGALVVPESDAWTDRWWLTDEPATFQVTAIDAAADFGTVRAGLEATPCAAREVTLTLTAGAASVERTVSLAAGQSLDVTLHLDEPTDAAQLTVTAAGELCLVPDGRYLSVAVLDPAAGV